MRIPSNEWATASNCGTWQDSGKIVLDLHYLAYREHYIHLKPRKTEQRYWIRQEWKKLTWICKSIGLCVLLYAFAQASDIWDRVTIPCLDRRLLDRKETEFWKTEKGIHDDISSGIQQSSELGPVLFVLSINDLPEDGDSNAKKSAGGKKLYRHINTLSDYNEFQADQGRLWECRKSGS